MNKEASVILEACVCLCASGVLERLGEEGSPLLQLGMHLAPMVPALFHWT